MTTAPTELKGKDAEITIKGVPVALVNFSLDGKTGTVSQDRIGNKYPRTSPGTTTLGLKFTNLDISGEQMAMAMATGAVASTRYVLNSCDTSANWAATGTESVISLDTSNKKKGTGCILVTNTGDASGNTIIATPSPDNKDLSGYHMLEAWVRSSVVGANVLTFGFGNATMTNTKAVTIQAVDTWQRITYDISAIADSLKNSVSAVGITMGSDSSGNTVYIDSVNALKGVTLGTPEYFDVTARMADPLDDTKYIDYFIPDCYFTDFSIAIAGGADKVIEGPISGGIKDASKIQMFRS